MLSSLTPASVYVVKASAQTDYWLAGTTTRRHRGKAWRLACIPGLWLARAATSPEMNRPARGAWLPPALGPRTRAYAALATVTVFAAVSVLASGRGRREHRHSRVHVHHRCRPGHGRAH